MGYTTDFSGKFKLNKPLSAARVAYLKAFAQTRRMKRNAALVEERPDPLRRKVGLPVGVDGGFFVGAGGMAGQEHSADVMEYNSPPRNQPGLWCQWVPTDDGRAIEWDGGEKFYDYVEWLEYLIENFLSPWGYKLNGRVRWWGEDSNDRGVVVVKDNEIRTAEDTITNELDEEEDEEDDEPTFTGDVPASARPPAIVVRTVKSKSNPKAKPHEVRISRTDGKMYCTCKGWQNNKTCRHMKDTTKEHILAALEQAGAEGGIGI